MIRLPRPHALSLVLLGLGLGLFIAIAWAMRAHRGDQPAQPERSRPGSYTVLAERLGIANDIAVGADGRIFVSVQGGPVFLFSVNGNGALSAPQPLFETREPWSQSPIASPRRLALDQRGNLFVEDGEVLNGGDVPTAVLRKVAPDKAVSTLTIQGRWAGRPGYAETMNLGRIEGLASDGDGNLYVSNDALLKIGAGGGVHVLYDPSRPPVAPGNVPAPLDLALHPDRSVVWLDHDNVVRKRTQESVSQWIAGAADGALPRDGSAREARFYSAERLAVAPDGSIYVLEGEYAVRKIAVDGTVSTLITDAASRNLGAITYPQALGPFRAIAVSAKGDIYLAGMTVVRFNLH